MGDLKVWDKAESALQAVLEKRMPGQWKENPEDAAFYGPKVCPISDASSQEITLM
jgi:threonyl-tRNA synthetase